MWKRYYVCKWHLNCVDLDELDALWKEMNDIRWNLDCVLANKIGEIIQELSFFYKNKCVNTLDMYIGFCFSQWCLFTQQYIYLKTTFFAKILNFNFLFVLTNYSRNKLIFLIKWSTNKYSFWIMIWKYTKFSIVRAQHFTNKASKWPHFKFFNHFDIKCIIYIQYSNAMKASSSAMYSFGLDTVGEEISFKMWII